MRMRRKSRLDERLAECDRHLLYVEGGEFYKKTNEEKLNILDLVSVFGNSADVYLDLGCGRGNFTLQAAKNYPERNFIGVEKISNVIIEGAERAKAENPDNCMFLNCFVENLVYHLPQSSIKGIYLNFSCPYPKKTYTNRRLTYPRYLDLYKYLLKDGGEIRLKTDSEEFFEYSTDTLKSNGFEITYATADLHSSPYSVENIETDYEKNFLKQGKKIFMLIAKIK